MTGWAGLVCQRNGNRWLCTFLQPYVHFVLSFHFAAVRILTSIVFTKLLLLAPVQSASVSKFMVEHFCYQSFSKKEFLGITFLFLR